MQRTTFASPTQARVAWIGAGLVLLWIGDRFGMWWLLLIAGFCAGWFLPRVRDSVITALALGLGSWGIDLLVQSFFKNIGGIAGLTAALAGLGMQAGYVVILATLLIACVLTLSGAWLGRAASKVFREARLAQAELTPSASKRPVRLKP